MEVNQLRLAIREHVAKNKDRYVDFLRNLIRFDSSVIDQGLGGNEGPVQAWLAEHLESMGCEVHVFEPDNSKMQGHRSFNPRHNYEGRPNVVAHWNGTNGDNHRSLVLNGHIDTMPMGEESAWSVHPLDGVIKDGYIIGRGAVDMKGGLATAVMAMAVLQEIGVPLKGDVILQSVVDEEGGGNGTLAACIEGYLGDGAVILEATDFQICRASRGAWQFGVRVPGKATHSSMKAEGSNAIDNAYEIIKVLYELERKWLLTKHHSVMSKQTVVIGSINGGFGPSAIPDMCEIQGVIEYLPAHMSSGEEILASGFEVQREVEEAVAIACQGHPFLKDHPVQIEWLQDCPPFYTAAQEPLVQLAAETSEGIFGQARVGGFMGGCDGRHFQYNRVPVVVWGPGDPVLAHAADERMKIEDYLKAIEFLAEFIVAWTEKRKECAGNGERQE